MKKGITLIEFLVGFLLISMFVACFLRASLYEDENIKIQNAKQEMIEKKITTENNQNKEEDITSNNEEEDTETEETSEVKEEAKQIEETGSTTTTIDTVEVEGSIEEPQKENIDKKSIPQFIEVLN